MSKTRDKALRELDDIWNDSETYADRLTAFLKLKTAAKPQTTTTPFVLGGFDVSFDVDVDLVKLPPKPLPQLKNTEIPAKQSLSKPNEETNTTKPSPLKAIQQSLVDPPTSPTRENAEQSRSSSLRYLRRSGGACVPGSDRLRRVAIQRRSRSLGRRSLLREFNDAAPNTSDSTSSAPKETSNSSTNTLNFLPKTSSTPAGFKQLDQQVVAPVSVPVAGSSLVQEQVETSMVFTQRREEVPLISTPQRSLASASTTGAIQRTFTVEMGPQPGQLLLSPSDPQERSRQQQRVSQLSPSRSFDNRQSSLRQRSSLHIPSSPVVRHETFAINTPPRLASQTLREPEFTVPETQPAPHEQTIQKVLQTLSGSPAVTPFVVVPISCVSPKPKQTPVKTHPTPTAPVATTASPSSKASGSPRFVQNVSEIMTDDDSDENQRESSSVPLNLAPSGGNTTRQRRLRKRSQRVKSPNQLLDLHYSRSMDSVRPRNRVTRQTVLNKPSKPAINGEQFAQELARMSNYEILDLRKRHSRGMVCPVNGHRSMLKEQQAIEERIEWEIMRRNLETTSPKRSSFRVSVPSASPRAISPTGPEDETLSNSSSMGSPAVPPAGFRDASLQIQSSVMSHASPKQQEPQQRRSRLRSRNASRLEKSSLYVPSAPSPDDFRDRSVQHQKTPKTLRERRRYHEPTLGEDELLAVCTPPSQFRRSNSGQTVLEPEVLPDPPEQYRRSKTRQQEWNKKADESNHHHSLANDEGDFSGTSLAGLEPEVLPDPPDQYRKSKTRQQEWNKKADEPKQQQSLANVDGDVMRTSFAVLEPEVLPNPPEQYRRSKTRQQEWNKKADESKQSLANDEGDFIGTPLTESPQRFQTTKRQQALAVAEHNVSPKHFRKTKTRQQKSVEVQHPNVSNQPVALPDIEPDMTTLPEPPPEFQMAKSREQQSSACRNQDLFVSAVPEITALTVPPLPFIDAVRTSVENEEQQRNNNIEFNHNEDQISLPINEPSPAVLIETVLNELPYTCIVSTQETTLKVQNSNKALEKDSTEKTAKSQEDDIFKKPVAPAPRSKRNRYLNGTKRELNNLRIMLPNETLPPDESDPNATGVRKSKRGHVPLRNTWVHTQSDPFSFMRTHYEKYLVPEKTKTKKRSAANNTDLLMGRPPLSSSTPRCSNDSQDNKFGSSGKRKREQHNSRTKDNQIQISGITPLSSIEEQLEQQLPDQAHEHQSPEILNSMQHNHKKKDNAMSPPSSIVQELDEQQLPEQPIEQKSKTKKRSNKNKVKVVEPAMPPPDSPPKKQTKRGRKKKTDSIPEPPEGPQPDSLPEPEVEPFPHSTSAATNEPQIEIESATQSNNQEQDNTFPLMNWLREVEDRTATSKVCNTEEETDSIIISRASNLQFSNLNGIDYAFYNGEDNYSVGYMRFKPLQVRGFNRAKRKLQFVALYGNFKVEVNSDGSKKSGPKTDQYTLNTGDLVEIKLDAGYNITNCLDEVSILLINRK